MDDLKNSITDLQAVDFAMGKVIADCFNSVNPDEGPRAFQRFIARPSNEKIFFAKNDDVQRAMRKLAHLEDEPARKGGDLPAVIYYRDQGLAADMNQHPQVIEATRFISEDRVMGIDTAMRITTIPITLTYSLLFLAWDRASIDRMALAWWGYVVPLGRRHSRFTVPYTFDGESFEVGASLNTPREILTSSEQVGEGDDMRLWGSRTMAEVNTQAVYGAKVNIYDYFNVIGDWSKIQ